MQAGIGGAAVELFGQLELALGKSRIRGLVQPTQGKMTECATMICPAHRLGDFQRLLGCNASLGRAGSGPQSGLYGSDPGTRCCIGVARGQIVSGWVQTAEDRATTVYAIELSVADPEGILKPGIQVDVSFDQ